MSRNIPPTIEFNQNFIQELAQKYGIENTNQLSQVSGITAANAYNTLNGKHFPSVQTIAKMLSGIGLSVEAIQDVLGPAYIVKAPAQAQEA